MRGGCRLKHLSRALADVRSQAIAVIGGFSSEAARSRMTHKRHSAVEPTKLLFSLCGPK